jgi:hypothetical protein
MRSSWEEVLLSSNLIFLYLHVDAVMQKIIKTIADLQQKVTAHFVTQCVKSMAEDHLNIAAGAEVSTTHTPHQIQCIINNHLIHEMINLQGDQGISEIYS